MAQISRPFQIAIAGVALLAVVWLLALRGHSASPTTANSPVTPTATTPARSSAQPPAGGHAGAPSKVYHGAAPGVEGLTRALAKAHGAVATSQQNAKALEQKSAQASSAAAPTTSSSAPVTPSTGAPVTPAPAVKSQSAGATSHPAAPSRQAIVESELKSGSVVVLLIWNPQGTEDALVHKNLQRLAALHRRNAHHRAKGAKKGSKGLHTEFDQPIAIHSATPGRVASFGSFTRDVQIFSTPTVLVINKRGQVTTLTGAPGVFSLEQATDEARHS